MSCVSAALLRDQRCSLRRRVARRERVSQALSKWHRCIEVDCFDGQRKSAEDEEMLQLQIAPHQLYTQQAIKSKQRLQKRARLFGVNLLHALRHQLENVWQRRCIFQLVREVLKTRQRCSLEHKHVRIPRI